MTKLTFLGTGGSVATAERDNTSFILRAEKDIVLVDCSGSVIQKLRKLGLQPRQVRDILVTHVHPDHIFGLPSFIHSLMLEEGTIRLHASAETLGVARRLLDLFGLRARKIKTRVCFWPLRPGRKTGLGNSLAFRALQVPHHSSSLAFHFYLEEDGKELVFSGDTPPHDLLFAEAHGVDYLVHDASAPARYFRRYPVLHSMHTSSLELGEWSRRAAIKCLIPCHFLGEVDFSPAEIRAEIRRSFRGRLIIPRDLKTIRL